MSGSGAAVGRPRPPLAALWWRVAGLLFLIGLLLAIGVVVYTKVVTAMSENVLSGTACTDLPDRATAEDALREHADLVRRIEAVSPHVDLELALPCEGQYRDRAEIFVYVATNGERDAVTALLDTEAFGVPVSIFNV